MAFGDRHVADALPVVLFLASENRFAEVGGHQYGQDDGAVASDRRLPAVPFPAGHIFVNLWTVVMAIVASYTAVKRTSLKTSVLLMPVFVGLLVTVLVVSAYFLGLVMQVDNVFSARYFIPVVGVLLGNMLTVDILALNVYYSELRREQQMYYYLLGNGATRFEATVPFLRSAVIRSFAPCIANMSVLGLVSFPGTMIGQILGGSLPDVAIKYQLMISVITVVASMMSLVITISLSICRSFDQYDCLKPIFKPSKS